MKRHRIERKKLLIMKDILSPPSWNIRNCSKTPACITRVCTFWYPDKVDSVKILFVKKVYLEGFVERPLYPKFEAIKKVSLK